LHDYTLTVETDLTLLKKSQFFSTTVLLALNRGLFCSQWFALHSSPTSDGSRPRVWEGGIKIRGRQKIFTCLNIPASLRQSLGVTQKLLHFLGSENGYFVARTTRSFRESPQFKIAFHH